MFSYLELFSFAAYALLFLFILTIYTVTHVCLKYNISLANRFNIFLDKPIHRSSHKDITPRNGGLSLFAITFPFLFIFDLWAALFSTLMFLIGILDDYEPLNNKIKLALISFFTIGLCYVKLHVIDFEFFFIFSLLMIIIIGFNFIDGLNGVAATLGFLSLSIVIFKYFNAEYYNCMYILVILVALISFLQVNLKGSVFMGDSGSMFIGSLIAYYSIDLHVNNLISSVDIAFLSGVFFMDLIAIVLFRIFFLRKNPFIADRNHIHHKLFLSSKSLTKTLTYLILIHLAIIAIVFTK